MEEEKKQEVKKNSIEEYEFSKQIGEGAYGNVYLV